MKSFKAMLCILIAAFLLTSTATTMARTKDELRSRFEGRFPKLAELKHSGKVGETFSGSVEAVSGTLDKDAQKLVDEENADRVELYGIIAKEENTTPQLVAERNARRNFDKAAKGEYLRDQDNQWHKKA